MESESENAVRRKKEGGSRMAAMSGREERLKAPYYSTLLDAGAK